MNKHTRPMGRVRRIRRVAAASAVVLVGAAGSLSVAEPASAAPISGVVRIENVSPQTATTAKSRRAQCPVGKVIINAGAYIDSGDGKVGMDDLYIDDVANSVNASAKETDQAFAGLWRLNVFATCADPVPGLQRVWVESEEDSDQVKHATATCPEGKTMLGTGGSIVGGEGEVWLTEIKPNGGPGVAPTSVTVEAEERDAVVFTGDWKVSAYAMCADPIDGLQTLSAQTSPGSGNNGTFVACPANQDATGTGAEIVGPAGQVVLDDAYPRDGSPNTAPTSTTVYGQEENATLEDWFIKAFVICAD